MKIEDFEKIKRQCECRGKGDCDMCVGNYNPEKCDDFIYHNFYQTQKEQDIAEVKEK